MDKHLVVVGNGMIGHHVVEIASRSEGTPVWSSELAHRVPERA